MDTMKTTRSQNNRYWKLSLKKNKLKTDDFKKLSRSSDVIILDESSDKLRLEFPKRIRSEAKIYSPIVIDDSSELSNDILPNVSLAAKEPSKCGNVSFDCSSDSPSPTKESQPSIGGWSPAQHIITANPRYDPIPSTPKDVANESHETCTIKEIEQSQKKILNELYGDGWKSIPTLFKTVKHRYDNFNGVTKKLFDDDEEKENIRQELKINKQLYLTSSDVKRNVTNFGDSEKKSKKKLYTEKVPCVPDVAKQTSKVRNVNSTTKKVKIKKCLTVTELVEVMKKDSDNLCKDDHADVLREKYKKDVDLMTKKSKDFDRQTNKNNVDLLVNRVENDFNILRKKGKDNDIYTNNDNLDILVNKIENDINLLTPKRKDVDKTTKKNDIDVLTKRIENVIVTPKNLIPKRLSFIGSLADNVPSWRCHPEAIQYQDNYKTLREQLTRRLYSEFNKHIFNDALDADMAIVWDGKLRSTAGTTTNRHIKHAKGDRIRTSSIKLSIKVVDAPQRLRDTLIHELCHAATWLIDAELKAGHGPLWKKWATRALTVYPELGEISRCHTMEIHFKYIYKCTKCGYSIKRHSKSIDITKKCCGYCRGTFEIVLNKKNKDGLITTTPARKGAPNGFAQYVKENYANIKDGCKTHAQVMKLLGEQFSAKKIKPVLE